MIGKLLLGMPLKVKSRIWAIKKLLFYSSEASNRFKILFGLPILFSSLMNNIALTSVVKLLKIPLSL